jgi:hypothetical protein
VRLRGEAVVGGGAIAEYVSGPVFAFAQNQPKRSLSLPVEEVPDVPWESDLSQWANVDAFGAKGDGETDDTEAVRAAMASGKPVVYLPRATYRVDGTVTVPSSVKRVTGLYGELCIGAEVRRPVFRVADDSPEPILIEDMRKDPGLFLVEHAGMRPVILTHCATNGQLYRNVNDRPGAKLFINNCNGFGKASRHVRDQQVWARFINTESPGPVNFGCDNSTMWVFGYKCEKLNTNFEALGGSRLEVLGGVANQFDHRRGADVEIPDRPIVRNVDSHVSYVGCTNGPSTDWGYETILEETRGQQVSRAAWTQFPPRVGREHQIVVPLYVGYR